MTATDVDAEVDTLRTQVRSLQRQPIVLEPLPGQRDPLVVFLSGVISVYALVLAVILVVLGAWGLLVADLAIVGFVCLVMAREHRKPR